MNCSTKKKLTILAVNAVIVSLFVVGASMMFKAVAFENYDNDLFMQSLAFLVVSATIGVRTLPKIQVFFRKTKATAESIIEKTGKMLALRPKEESGQQA